MACLLSCIGIDVDVGWMAANGWERAVDLDRDVGLGELFMSYEASRGDSGGFGIAVVERLTE